MLGEACPTIKNALSIFVLEFLDTSAGYLIRRPCVLHSLHDLKRNVKTNALSVHSRPCGFGKSPGSAQSEIRKCNSCNAVSPVFL
jgi:hypothetical protein